jgi:hypothetical protein
MALSTPNSVSASLNSSAPEVSPLLIIPRTGNMAIFHFRGTLCVPSIVAIEAEKESHATIRAMYGEYDSVLNQGKTRFEIDPSFDPVEVPDLPKHRYRAIFTETTTFAVEFDSSMSLNELESSGEWREALDNDAVSRRFCWQAECAVDVKDLLLEHLEELPRGVRK